MAARSVARGMLAVVATASSAAATAGGPPAAPASPPSPEIAFDAANPEVLQLSGACDERDYLNSVFFEKQGTTYNDSPYFKARGKELYIYFDADCAGGGDGTPRWILDKDKPIPGHVTDLDGDMACNYQARINSDDGSKPPLVGYWWMECAGKWEERFLALMADPEDELEYISHVAWPEEDEPTEEPEEVDEPSAEPEEHAEPAPKPTPTAPPVNFNQFQIAGACKEKAFLHALVFKKLGTTASGRPFYGSTSLGQYIYYDPACDGNTDGAEGMWIIDTDAPDKTRKNDLDKDGKCAYHARLVTDSKSLPTKATWHVKCGSKWSDLKLTISLHEDEEEEGDEGEGDDEGSASASEEEVATEGHDAEEHQGHHEDKDSVMGAAAPAAGASSLLGAALLAVAGLLAAAGG